MGNPGFAGESESPPPLGGGADAPLLNVSAATRVLRKRAAWLAVALVFGLAAGMTVGWISSPVYRAETLLAPVTDARGASLFSGVSGSLAGLAGLVGVNLGGSGTEESAFATLSSRSLSREFISKEDLLPVLFAEDASSPIAVFTSRTIPSSERSMERAVDFFLSDVLSVSRDRRTGLVTLATEWKDPVIAAEWANGLTQLANDRLRLQAVGDSQRAVEYLAKELGRNSSVQVQQSIYRIIEAQMSAAAAANASPDFAFKVVDGAVAPDVDDFVRPRRAVLAVITGMLFFMSAVAGSLWLARRELWV